MSHNLLSGIPPGPLSSFTVVIPPFFLLELLHGAQVELKYANQITASKTSAGVK